jgi:four helix bundle protein
MLRFSGDIMSGTFEDLEVWQWSMELVYEIYSLTQEFPKPEIYGLASQLRRAAVSIPSNIAEGKGRASDRDFAVFLGYARGSLHELHTQLLIAKHLGYISEAAAETAIERIGHVGRMLSGLIAFASRRQQAGIQDET